MDVHEESIDCTCRQISPSTEGCSWDPWVSMQWAPDASIGSGCIKLFPLLCASGMGRAPLDSPHQLWELQCTMAPLSNTTRRIKKQTRVHNTLRTDLTPSNGDVNPGGVADRPWPCTWVMSRGAHRAPSPPKATSPVHRLGAGASGPFGAVVRTAALHLLLRGSMQKPPQIRRVSLQLVGVSARVNEGRHRM